MPPQKAKPKKGGVTECHPLKRSPVQSASSEHDDLPPEMRALLARLEALEKAVARTEAVATQASSASLPKGSAKTTGIENINKSLQDVAENTKERECEGSLGESSFHSTINRNGTAVAAWLWPPGIECWRSGGSISSSGLSCPPLRQWPMPPPQVQPQSFGLPWEEWCKHARANCSLPIGSSGPQTARLGYVPPSSMPFQPHPYLELAVPLGFHLLPATKEKIKNGEYVDMFSLLFREPNDEQLKQVDRIFDNWLPAYFIYVGVILEDQPNRGYVLLKYLDIIHRASVEFCGSGWLRYDESFRRQAAQYPFLPWDKVIPGLWMQYVCTDQPVYGEYSDSGHLIISRSEVDTFQGRMGKKSQGVCWDFNKGRGCSHRFCKFKHQCLDCGASHPRSLCWSFQGEQIDESEQDD